MGADLDDSFFDLGRSLLSDGQFEAIDDDMAGLGFFQPVQASEKRALTRSAAANDHNHLPRYNIGGNAVQNQEVLKVFLKVLDDDNGFHKSFLPSNPTFRREFYWKQAPVSPKTWRRRFWLMTQIGG
jgi:hypothetical protein